MKLSEAILQGSTMLDAKPGAQYFSDTKSGCALGMAAIARGCSFHRITRPINYNERRTLGTERVWGQWVLRVVMRPCDCWFLRVPRKMRIKDIIAHLFDFHVMKKKELDTKPIGSVGTNLGARRNPRYADSQRASSQQIDFARVADSPVVCGARMAASSPVFRGAAQGAANRSRKFLEGDDPR
jgi:hypothetical protein